jgi:hypothetical protein
MLAMYATSYSIAIEEKANEQLVARFSFTSHDDEHAELIKDMLLDPDDDGNYYVSDFGWRARLYNGVRPRRSPTSKSRSSKSRSSKSRSPTRRSPTRRSSRLTRAQK